MRKTIVGLALVSMASAAWASDWVEFGRNPAGVVFYLDRESVRQDGRYLAAWSKQDASKAKGIDYHEGKGFHYFDCDRRRVALKEFTVFDAAGVVKVMGVIQDPSLEWEEASPESVAETMVTIVCSR